MIRQGFVTFFLLLLYRKVFRLSLQSGAKTRHRGRRRKDHIPQSRLKKMIVATVSTVNIATIYRKGAHIWTTLHAPASSLPSGDHATSSDCVAFVG